MSTWKERVPDRTYVDEYPAEALSPRRKSVYGSQKSVSKSSTSAAAPGDDPVRIARTLMASRTPRRPRIFPPPKARGHRPRTPPRREWGERHMKTRLAARSTSTIVDVHSNWSVSLYREMRIGIVFGTSNITPYYFGPSRGNSHGTIRASRSLGRHELGEGKSGGPERPDCRGRLRSDCELQPGTHPGLCADRLAEGHQRSRDEGHRLEGRPR